MSDSNNYFKLFATVAVSKTDSRGDVAHRIAWEKFFFFDDRDCNSRAEALNLAQEARERLGGRLSVYRALWSRMPKSIGIVGELPMHEAFNSPGLGCDAAEE